ncbi:MAG: chromate transporter [Candidatus Rokuibacteriota bacterium]|nr:MAG: chromate transporter [Candidatus Rokubacteria bacterium]PYN12789.1 MAG: chromate transporter [Candidatus Rokubacteria bacterium]
MDAALRREGHPEVQIIPARLAEVGGVFLKLGLVGFGGPAAHIALMQNEVVDRRGWVSRERFLDLLGATNLIPGPNSTEMAIHLGFVRAGWWGLLLAGVCFATPATLIVLGCAWAYVRWGALPQATSLLYGIKPVLIAIVAQALVRLARTAWTGPLAGATALGVAALALAGVDEVLLLFAGALGVMLATNVRPGMRCLSVAPVTLPALGLLFLKVGSILFGSGYVLLAFLRADLVERLGWISDAQLLDAVAVGQLTPGPVSTTATFIGYLVAGGPGAVVATLGIFLPSFVLVAASTPLLPKLRASRWAGAFLDGANAASLALMAVVTWQLGRAALVDWITALLALGATLLVFGTRVHSAWLIAGGAALGLAVRGLA